MAIKVKNLKGVKSTTVSLGEDLAARLRDDILSGLLKKGDKLTEQVICKQYQVSRTPVREALVVLETEGLVGLIPNRGAFVIGFSERDMYDMFTLRKIYEIQATRWAVERITEEEMAEFRENYDFMEFYTMKKDLDKMLNINSNFHQIIYKASCNQLLRHLLTSYQVYLRHIPASFEDLERYLNTVLQEHRRIFEAFEAKDADAATEAMAIHMDESQKRHFFME